jgi:hypothetical protein
MRTKLEAVIPKMLKTKAGRTAFNKALAASMTEKVMPRELRPGRRAMLKGSVVVFDEKEM